MEQRKFETYSALAQIGAWLLLFAVMFLDSLIYEDGYNGMLYALNFVVVMVVMVYMHYHFVLPILIRGQRWLYGLIAVPYSIFFSGLVYFSDMLMPYNYEEGTEFEGFWEMFAYAFPIALLLLAGSSFYYFVDAWFKSIKKESLLKSEKLQAELNFLKSQINPHFLFNTLNNIYSYVQTGNEKTAPMLERLSSVLRFMVYECSEERVELAKELEAVEDLLEIYKMKNSDQENIELSITGVKGYHLIAPLIIVNLVENACKHSDAVTNADGFIHVNIMVDEHDQCLCKISNSIRQKQKVDSKYGGVGFENVVQRLQLQYGDSYKLEKKEWNNNYYLTVGMPLERKI